MCPEMQECFGVYFLWNWVYGGGLNLYVLYKCLCDV